MSKTGSGSSGSKSDGRQGSNSASKFGSKGNDVSSSDSSSSSTKNRQQEQEASSQNAPGSKTFGDSHGQQDKAGHKRS